MGTCTRAMTTGWHCDSGRCGPTTNPMHAAALEQKVAQKDGELEASKATIEELRRENEQLSSSGLRPRLQRVCRWHASRCMGYSQQRAVWDQAVE